MDTLEIAWAAGLFEGEGCAALCKNGVDIVPRLYLNMTDEDVMRKFFKIVGVGILYEPTEYSKNKPRCKPQWRWTVNKRGDVIWLMDQLQPYMCSRRSEKFNELRAEAAREYELAHVPEGDICYIPFQKCPRTHSYLKNTSLGKS